MKNKIIVKVYSIKQSGQKLITVPKNSDIEVGDFIKIIKMEFR